MTASTLYEAIEPQMLWKQLLTAVFAEIVSDKKQFEASTDDFKSCCESL
jgi:hypothetical protein